MAIKKQEEKPMELTKATVIALPFMILGSVVVDNLSTLTICLTVTVMIIIFTQRWVYYDAYPPQEEVSRWVGWMFWVVHRLTMAVTFLQFVEMVRGYKWYQVFGWMIILSTTYALSAKFAALYWKPASQLTETANEVG